MTRSGTNFQMARSTLATGASEEQEKMDKDIQPGIPTLILPKSHPQTPF